MNHPDSVSIEICARPTGPIADGIMSIVNELTGEWFTTDVADATERDLLFHDAVCAWEGGQIRSFIMFTSHDGMLHMTLMGTSPQYRGRGVGSALLERLVTHATDLGFGELVAFTVPPTSRPAYGATVMFYQKHGFRVVQEHSELWQSGAWELRKSLSGGPRNRPGDTSEDETAPTAGRMMGGQRMIRMRYHHLGIPTTTPQPGETYLADYKAFCTDHESNPFGIQWMRYEEGCPLPDLVKTVPHVAFEVDDLARALEGHQILIQPASPSERVLVAFVVCDGAPVEFLQFVKK